MLHKHPSAEKAQIYFGITEKLKHDAANFFICIQPKLGQIYDNSVYRALGENFNFQDVRDKHLTHLSTLLTGGIDHRFIEESHSLQKKYAGLGVTTGEYVKLYQLIISYLSGEAHKKHWWRYKKYRDLNRSIRNLLLFDLAIATSPKELESSVDNFKQSKNLLQPALLDEASLEYKTTLDELNLLLENSHAIINECHQVIQSVLELTQQSKTFLLEDTSNDAINVQPSLFANDFEETLELIKMPSNQNRPAFEEVLSLTQEKIQKVSQLVSTETKEMDPQQINALEELLNDIHEDISTLSTIQGLPVSKNKSKVDPSHHSLHELLKKSSAVMGSHLNSLEQLKEQKILLKKTY
jgi:D-ribose pyranose/furanose isomerase RbsD